MTSQELAYACLEYIGEASMTLTGGYNQTAVYRALVRAQNQARQELFKLNRALFKRTVGVSIAAAATGSITVANGSTAISASTGLGSSGTLAGNSISIGGQTEWNHIYDAAARFLLAPYTGTAGAKTATIYGDAVFLDAAYSRPLGPVWLADIRELRPLASESDLLGYDVHQPMNTDWGRVPSGTHRLPSRRTVAQPTAFFVDTFLSGTNRVRLRLSPVPDAAYTLNFVTEVRPAVITTVDLGSEGADPGATFSLPDGADEHFLLPLVLYHWSTKPFFKDTEGKRQIIADYAARIAEFPGYNVQPQTGNHRLTAGWRRRFR